MADDALVPNLAEEAVPPQSSRLLSLPLELLETIVQMSRAQDEAFKERMQISRARIKVSTYAVTTEATWYGWSLRALYSTSKKLNDLCRPYVWESVSLTQTVDDLFSDSLLERYGVFVRHLNFDCKPESFYTSALPGLLIATLSMPNIERFSFAHSSPGDLLSSIAHHHRHRRPDVETVCLRPALASLKTRIKKLSFEADLPSTDFCAALELWPNATHLARNLRQATDLNGEGQAISDLDSLTHLELGTCSSYGQYDVEELFVSDEDPIEWPASWTDLEWPAGLRSLSFACPYLRLEEWEFIAHLSEDLEELRLKMMGTHANFQGDLRAPPICFPRLHSLSITGGLHGIHEILRLLHPSTPLSTVNLEIIDMNGQHISALVSGREGIDGCLATFSATLNKVDISQYGYQTDILRQMVRASIQSAGLKPHLKGKKRLYSPIFCHTGEDLLNDEWGSPAAQVNAKAGLRSALDLLHRTTTSLSNLDIEADVARLDIVKQALRSLAALDLLDKD